MINSALLTICIPTYNRPNALALQLQTLIPQLTKEVLLVVRDNCSNYFLEDLLSTRQMEKLVYIRNKHNIGADANIARCIEECKTKWVWVLGDDDLVKHNAVQEALRLIKLNGNHCYINMQAKKNKQTIGYLQFVDFFKIKGVFPGSFCTSLCLYNVTKLNTETFSYYRNVSTMITQFVFVMKFLRKNPNEKCLFSEVQIIENQSLDISWKYEDFIVYTSLLFYIFREDRKILNKNVFKSLGTMYIDFLFKEMKDVRVARKLKLFIFIICRLGIRNALKYNSVTFIDNFLFVFLPVKTYTVLRNKISLKYNTSL